MVTVRNKFDILQKTSKRHTPNDEYEKFVTTNWEQQPSAFQPNQVLNIEFQRSQ